jgi:hypothetical protein
VLANTHDDRRHIDTRLRVVLCCLAGDPPDTAGPRTRCPGATDSRSKPRGRDRSGLRGPTGFNALRSDRQLAQDGIWYPRSLVATKKLAVERLIERQ